MRPPDGSRPGLPASIEGALLRSASGAARGFLAPAAALLILAAVLPAPVRGASAKMGGAPTLSRTTVPAHGEQESLLTVGAFGRYAVTVKSPAGTSLQLVDRMTGPGEPDGSPGEQDGRLDQLLDRGEYKLLLKGPAKAKGEARIEVHPFKELNAPRAPLLVELKAVQASLDDFEQRSYWIEIKERRRVILEAAGRNLADLRLWKDGSWLVDAQPQCETAEPRAGRPLFVCRLAADLPPGLYLLTAYGGREIPWAEGSPERPFHLRFGIPSLGTAGRARHVVSPFGTDRWLVPGEATYFRLELPEARPASLRVGPFSAGSPFAESGQGGDILKNSRPPATEVFVSSGDAPHIVTVKADAGQAYVLQHFEHRSQYTFSKEGAYWISTVHSGHAADSVDATGILVDRGRTLNAAPLADGAVNVGDGRGWAARANLLAPLTVHLRIVTGGKYEIVSRGTEARFRIEPFMISRPPRYVAPPFRSGGSVWELDPGYHVLTVDPVKKGILDMEIRPAGLVETLRDLSGLKKDTPRETVRASLLFPKVDLDRRHSYTLYLNERPEVRSGLVLRQLPVDLSDPLPLTQRSGEPMSVPIRIGEPGTIRAEAEDGTFLEVSVDAGPWTTMVQASAGTHTVAVRHGRVETVVYSLGFAPTRLKADTPLPALPDTALAGLPKFPVLSAGKPLFLDLEREETKTFLVRADTPGIYRLETTGLLATGGNLRGRVVTSMERRSTNGVGRNFLIQRYLREGDYQVTVSAEGQSAGHAGLRLVKTDPVNGGELAADIPARLTLDAGQGAVYRFRIPRAGRYRIESIGVERTFSCRLEDKDGWPIEKPGIVAAIERHFGPGEYRIFTLPEAVEGRRVTRVAPVLPAPQITGHGPHPLVPGSPAAHVWREPAAGGERTPDVWTFSLAAPAEVSLDLSDEMEGALRRDAPAAENAAVAKVSPKKGWKGTLAAGAYRLEAVCSRTNNGVPYQVAVTTRELLPGQRRNVSVPAVIPISVETRAGGQLVEIWSYGRIDVRARLLDNTGKVVASDDDRPDDWNFLVSRRLAPGTYRLEIEPGGRRSAGHVRAGSPDTPGPVPAPDSRFEEEAPDAVDPSAGGDAATESDSVAGSAEDATEDGGALVVAPSAPQEGPVAVSLDVPEEVPEPALSMPARFALRPGTSVHLYPINLPERADAVTLAARSDESVGLSLEASSGASGAEHWSTLGTAVGRSPRLDVPVERSKEQPGRRYRMRLWAVDRRGNEIGIAAAAPEAARYTEDALAKGIALRRSGGSADTAVALVTLSRPGLFRLSGAGWSPAPGIPSNGVTGTGLVEATGPSLWLFPDPLHEDGEPLPARGARAFLDKVPDDGLLLEVPSDRTVAVDIAPGPAGPLLIAAASRSIQPGVRVAERADGPSYRPAGHGMGVGVRSAIAVSLSPREPVALAWQADAGEAASLSEIRVRQKRFPPPALEKADPGITIGSLSPGSARSFELARTRLRLRLAVADSTVGVISRGADVQGVAWNGGAAFEETLVVEPGEADRLTLLNAGEDESRFWIESVPMPPGEAAVVGPGRPWELHSADAGRTRLSVQGEEASAVVHVRGTEEAPVLISADGKVSRGFDLPAGPGAGTLILPHGPGTQISWMDRAGDETPALWGGDLPKAVPVALPAAVPLSGRAQAFRIEAPGPLVLHARGPISAVSYLMRGAVSGREAPRPEVEVHQESVGLDIYLPGGTADLALRALGAGSLSGALSLTATPVTPTGEGLGPQVLLPAGAARAFSFEVKRKGPVGIGVRSNADVVESVLTDAAGKVLGKGVVMMPTLEPGTYILTLRAPAGASPVLTRPALAGVEPPDTRPPAEVVREYMERARGGEVPEASPED